MITVPKDIPQKVFDNLIDQQFQHIFPHFTMELVQKIMTLMQGSGLDFKAVLEEFQLRKTKIVIEGNRVIYQMPPVNLTTFWVFEQDNYKINSFEHKVNWPWMLVNFPKVLKYRNKMKQVQTPKEIMPFLSRIMSLLNIENTPLNSKIVVVMLAAALAGLIATPFLL